MHTYIPQALTRPAGARAKREETAESLMRMETLTCDIAGKWAAGGHGKLRLNSLRLRNRPAADALEWGAANIRVLLGAG